MSFDLWKVKRRRVVPPGVTEPPSVHTLAVGVRCEIFLCRLLLWLLSLHSLDDGSDLALAAYQSRRALCLTIFCHVHSYEYLHHMLG